MTDGNQPRTFSIASNGVWLTVDEHGAGDAVLLVHGFPHTRKLWSAVAPVLATAHRVLSVDLRGCGDSTRAREGYDAVTLAADLLGVLDGCGLEVADVVAIDAGVPAAVALGLLHPDRVGRLAVMESTVGRLPGAEDFFSRGAPWWFGFHQVPGLAEVVLVGHEREYLEFFMRIGTHDGAGVDPDVLEHFVAAFRGSESLRCGFEHYRAMPTTAAQLADLAARTRLPMPTLAIGAAPVGDALGRQLAPLCDDLHTTSIPDCGHLIPLDRPEVLAGLLTDFLTPHAASGPGSG